MKLRYIFAAAAAVLTLAVSCQKEGDTYLNNVKVSSSYVALPAEGGSVTIAVNANYEWAIDSLGKDTTWLSVSPMAGVAGETAVTFTAKAATETQETTVFLNCLGETQRINVIQMTEKTETPLSTCAEVIAGPDSKTYRVTGAVTKISESVKYGNFYLNDGTGDVYVYGTKYEGQTQQGALEKLGVEVGDVITIEGPKTTYNGTVELVDVDVISLVKSLLAIEPDSFNVEKGDTVVEVKLVYKGDDLEVLPQEDWIQLAGVNVGQDTTVVSIHVDANEDDTREGTVIIRSSIPTQTTELSLTITQATGLSMYPLPYAEDFSKGQGAWTVNVTTARTDGKDIWSVGSYSGTYYMKASAGSAIDTKSMLVSPLISLKDAKSPVLTFSHCGKYFGNQQLESTLWVSTDNGTSWTQLLIPEHDNAYGWMKSGDISLASLVGSEYFQIGFQYISANGKYGTWEIADIKVEDRDADFTGIGQVNNSAAATSADFTVTLKDAVVSYVNGSNAFIEDATGGIQLYAKDHGLTAGSVINGEVSGKVVLYNGFAEATAFDVTKATVTTGTVTPTTLTLAALNAGYLRYQNCLVKLEGVTLVAGAAGTAKASDTVKQGEDSVASYTQVKTIAYDANTSCDLTCIPTRYKTTLQVGIWETSWIEKK